MKLNDRVRFAREFAAALHADQGQLYDDKPYTVHLDDVYNILLEFDVIDKDVLAAGYLHDLIEDTEIDISVIKNLFGDDIAEYVWAVTDEPGENRKQRKALTYPKIKANPYGGLTLKLADRIANVRYSIKSGNVRMQKMYQKEMGEFEKNLRTLGLNDEMWNHLTALCLHPGFAQTNVLVVPPRGP